MNLYRFQAGSISNLSRKLLDIESMSDFTVLEPVAGDSESVVTLPRLFTPSGATGGAATANSVGGAGKRPLYRPPVHGMSQLKE